MRRTLRTINTLVGMLEAAQIKADSSQTYFEAERESAVAVEARERELQNKINELVARIAELEARPATPSLEQVVDAFYAYLDGPFSAHDFICNIFDVDWDRAEEEFVKAGIRYRASEDDGA